MGYEIHIERETEIPVEEWKGAVENIDGVRLASGDFTQKNPVTGEEIRIPVQDGDAEAFLSEKEGWTPAFRWSSAGRAALASGAADLGRPEKEISPCSPVH